jgi:general secretion pathway protein J
VTGWNGSRLIGGAASLSIAYFGAHGADAERSWRSHWDDQSRAPELIRIRLGFAAGDDRLWPDLIVRPAVFVDLACDPEMAAAACGGRT